MQLRTNFVSLDETTKEVLKYFLIIFFREILETVKQDETHETTDVLDAGIANEVSNGFRQFCLFYL